MPDYSTPSAIEPLAEPPTEPIHSPRKIHFILNPVANKGKATKYVSLFREWFSNTPDVAIEVTEASGDATRLAEKSASNVVVACGGDGTFNEVAQALVHTSGTMGCVPLGSGNDFFRNFSGKNAEPPKRDSLLTLFSESPRVVDTACVSFSQQSNQDTTRYFLNSLGLGFTGRIAAVASKFTRLRGDLIYAYALLHVARTFRASPMRVEMTTPSGTILVDERVFALSIGNGKREGGKFWIAPKAEMTDGLLDVCILKAFPMWQLPQFIFLYLQGKQHLHRNVIYAQATCVTIELSRPETLHLDGEVFENLTGKLTVDVCPRSLNIVIANSK